MGTPPELQRAFQVLQEEGGGAAMRAALRKVLSRLGLYPQFNLPKALQEMGRVWPEEAISALPVASARASIIILTYNNLDYTRLCLRSVYATSAPVPFEVVVVDNNSHDGTPDFLRSFASVHPNCVLVLNSSNLGFSAGNNAGAASASGQILVFLNNDTIVTPGWLAGLMAHLKDPDVGMVGPRTNYWGNESRIETRYRSLQDLLDFAVKSRQMKAGQRFEIPMLGFFCVALRREVFEAVGTLDERFGVGMFEDDDYALRIRRKGYKLFCCEDVFVHHWGKASFSLLEKEKYKRLFQENLRKYEDKWGLKWQTPLK